MPTSNSTNFSLNAQQLINASLRLARLLGVGQTVEAEVYNIATENLNIMMRHWENTGVRIWGIERAILFPSLGQSIFSIPLLSGSVPNAYACLETDYRQNTLANAVAVGDSSITLSDAVTFLAGDYVGIATDQNGLQWYTVHQVVGQVVSLYNVGTTTPASIAYTAAAANIVVGFTTLAWQPLRIIEARRVDLTSAIEVPLKIIGKFDYERIPNKTLQSIPIQCYQQVLIDHTDLYVWPTTGFATWAIAYSFERRYQDIDSSINSLDFPPESYEALRYGLAARLGMEFAIAGDRQQYLDAKAEAYFGVMRSASSGKASVRFGVSR